MRFSVGDILACTLLAATKIACMTSEYRNQVETYGPAKDWGNEILAVCIGGLWWCAYVLLICVAMLAWLFFDDWRATRAWIRRNSKSD
jgi:hypothetical protein